MTDLSVIILNWNTRDDLHRCLTSLEPAVHGDLSGSARWESSVRTQRGRTEGTTVEVIVVDNASSDDSVRMAEEQFPWAQVIANERNVGFSAGNNVGIRAAKGRYLLLLNPDTVVHGDALDTLVEFADAHPDTGIVGAKLLNRDGSLQYSCRRFPTLANGFFRDTPLGRLFPKNRYNRDYLMTDWDHRSPREVDWVSGAAMLLRRECLDGIGLLDEAFFMYCEDVDICYRAWQQDWKVRYCPDAVITHLIAQSSDQNAAAMLMERHRSMYRFFRKHYAAQTHPLAWPLIVAGLSARAGALVVKNKIDRMRQARAERKRPPGDARPPLPRQALDGTADERR
ncbi:MAG: glycosyltransferase [Armatimonadetes bacterium]|nr:glycosyltransferase [Armatimonadota bacterium]